MPFDRETIHACPHCQFLMRSKAAQRASNLEGVYWTDGKEYLPFFPSVPRLVQCSNCNKVFWKKFAAVACVSDPSTSVIEEHPSSWEHVTARDRPPALSGYLQALDDKLYTTDEEENYIRTQLWWVLNDPVRYGRARAVAKEQEALFQDNLSRLRVMYHDTESGILASVEGGGSMILRPAVDQEGCEALPVQDFKPIIESCRLHMAEISRELGEFDMAGKYLEDILEYPTREAEELTKFISERDPSVRRFSFSYGGIQLGKTGAIPDPDAMNRKGDGDHKSAWESFVDMFR